MKKLRYFGLPATAAFAALLALSLVFLGCDNNTTINSTNDLTGKPTISGTAMVGETLTAGITGLNGTGIPAYQWKAGETKVGTDQDTYQPAAGDVGKTITVTVSYSGNTGSRASDPKGPVTADTQAEGNKEALQEAGEITASVPKSGGGNAAVGIAVGTNGKITLTIDGNSKDYPYTITGDTITLQGAGEDGADANLEYRINENTLTITGGLEKIAGANLAPGPVTSNENGALKPPLVVTALALDTLVTVPVKGETPQSTFAGNTQYTGTIAWKTDADADHTGAFAPSTVYKAVVTLTAKTGYTFTGVAANSFTHSGGTVTNATDSGTVTITFLATAAAGVDDPVTALNLTALVTAPVKGATQNTTAINTAQYTGTIVWFENDGITAAPAAFAAGTVYKAVVTLTAQTGFTFTGVAANSFIYTDATVTNAANSGTVTITFPATTTPVLSADSVSDLSTATGTTATLKFTSGEAGTYYYVVLAAGTSAPTAVAVKAASSGIHGTASALAAENTISVTGLTPSSTNTAYIVVEDAAGNLSAVLSITGVNPVVPATTVPVLSAGSVSDLSTATGTTATLKFTSGEAGTYYYVVLASGVSAPTAATVKVQGTAAAKGTAAAIAAVNTISVTGLTPSSTYTAYIVVEDTAGNLSSVLTISGVNPVIATVPVSFSGLTADDSASVTTTKLTLTFDTVITGLTEDDITITANETGATPGTLSGAGPVYELTVSGISAGGSITVAVAKAGYTFTPASKTVTVQYIAPIPVPVTPMITITRGLDYDDDNITPTPGPNIEIEDTDPEDLIIWPFTVNSDMTHLGTPNYDYYGKYYFLDYENFNNEYEPDPEVTAPFPWEIRISKTHGTFVSFMIWDVLETKWVDASPIAIAPHFTVTSDSDNTIISANINDGWFNFNYKTYNSINIWGFRFERE
ncbi:hypothetical protein AGMMS4952_23310 [Spirochaetia bacterium]|nr:hypothetical protein AGMMS4952_23310 [Spirochaetia bacterium]